MCLVNMTCKQSFWPDKLIAILAGHCQLTGCFFEPSNVCDKLGVCQQLPGCQKNIFTASHSGKLKLAFTSSDVISTSPKSFLKSRIDYTVLVI